jgi:hypothetical protein
MSDNIKYRKELTKPTTKVFPKRTAVAFANDDLWTADIVDYITLSKLNKNFKYLLCIMDIYSRFVFVFPLKDKKGLTVLKCFKELKSYGKNLWIDKGGEFLNNDFKKFCNDNDINMYHTFGESKAVYIERFNRTLKQRINNYFLENNTNRYIDKLDDIIDNYNNTKHSSTNKTPYSVYYGNEKPEVNYYIGGSDEPKYKIGDYVRISRVKGVFEKGYAPKWSKEVFKISSIDKQQDPIMYQIEDQLKEKIEGKFYEPELQKTLLKDFSMIEKVIRTKTVKGVKMYYVKYDGYDDKFNEWVNEEQVDKRKK